MYSNDIETIINCSVFVFEDIYSDEVRSYVIHDLQDDRQELYNFLHKLKNSETRLVTFNGLAFDSQILEYMMRFEDELCDIPAIQVAHNIYLKAQETIRRSNNREFSEYSPYNLSIKHIDVFKQGHFDNPAKRSSLKWLQYTTDWYNIEEMPIHHSIVIKTQEQIDEIVSYCKNDVSSTKHLFKIFTPQTELRMTFSQKFEMDLLSSSEASIAKKIFSYYLAPKMKMSAKSFKELRTFRKEIVVKEILLPYIKFKSRAFNGLLKAYEELIIDPEKTKDAFKYVVKIKDITIEFGLGGVHGAAPPNTYFSTKDSTIESFDVISFYPNLFIRNKWSPRHIPTEIFCEQYEWFFDERVKIPKKDPVNYLLKIVLNSAYGLTNEKNNPLYDPLVTMATTINGQLLLMMLYEDILLRIPEAIPLMANTDGAEVLIPNSKKHIYQECCDRWMETTMLKLEYDSYEKLFIRDVNNYLGLHSKKEIDKKEYSKIKEKGLFPTSIVESKYYYNAVKCKGAFEFENLALHKNKSFLVVRKMIYYYLIFGILPEHTMNENRNIMDYCGGIKTSSEWKFYQMCSINGEVTKEPLQKVNRYYVSKKGCKIIKENVNDGRVTQVHAGNYYQTIFNKAEEIPWLDYNLNQQFYLKLAYAEIAKLVNKVQNLLF